MEILNNFGVNPVLFIAQVVNFLIVFYVLKRFLYKPVLSVLKKREASIKDGLKHAEEARKLLEDATQKEKTILKQAQVDAKKILEDARNQKDAILKESKEDAKLQAKQILDEARAQIAFEIQESQKRLTVQLSGMAIEFLQKSLAELFNKEDQELIIKNAIKKIKKRAD